MFKPIELKVDVDGANGEFRVAGVVEAKAEPIRNPVTGNVHRPKVSLQAGFEFAEAEFASGSAKAEAPIKLDTANCHAHLARLHLTGDGIVR
jgi:hypothetical protein